MRCDMGQPNILLPLLLAFLSNSVQRTLGEREESAFEKERAS